MLVESSKMGNVCVSSRKPCKSDKINIQPMFGGMSNKDKKLIIKVSGHDMFRKKRRRRSRRRKTFQRTQKKI